MASPVGAVRNHEVEGSVKKQRRQQEGRKEDRKAKTTPVGGYGAKQKSPVGGHEQDDVRPNVRSLKDKPGNISKKVSKACSL